MLQNRLLTVCIVVILNYDQCELLVDGDQVLLVSRADANERCIILTILMRKLQIVVRF